MAPTQKGEKQKWQMVKEKMGTLKQRLVEPQALVVTDRSPALSPLSTSCICMQPGQPLLRRHLQGQAGQVWCSKQWCVQLQSARAVGPTGPHDLPASHGLISDAADGAHILPPAVPRTAGSALLSSRAISSMSTFIWRRHFLARCT